MKQNANGTISLTKCCEVSGLGPENKPHRDGSFEYYMSENVRDNDPKGIGPFIWASLEMERLGFTVQNLDTHTAVSAPKSSRPTNGIRYDLQGRKISNSSRGIIIQDGRKYLISH